LCAIAAGSPTVESGVQGKVTQIGAVPGKVYNADKVRIVIESAPAGTP
jgi:hypothetical protein